MLVRRYYQVAPRTPALGPTPTLGSIELPPGVALDEWHHVTPGGVSLVPGYSQASGSSNIDDNFGAQDPIADPTRRGVFYLFVCYQGCWESTDFGRNFAKVSGTSVLDAGKNWGAGITLDGRLLNTCGNNFTTDGAGSTAEVRRTVQWSEDQGRTWFKTADLGGDPYNVAPSPYDRLRALCAFHDNNTVAESFDGGKTWVNQGAVNAAITNSGYIHYLHNSDTALYVGTDGENTYRGDKSSGSWVWTRVTDLDGAGHLHGQHQIFYDPVNDLVFHPAGNIGAAAGIYKSTNKGVNFTRVFSTNGENCIVATPAKLFAMSGGPQNTGTVDPKVTSAPRPSGTVWDTPTAPSGMVNGSKRMAVQFDGARYAIVSGNWHAGFWRLVTAA